MSEEQDQHFQFEHFLELRGVRNPCSRCGGLGVYLYGSTATWRGGIGGAAMTRGVCDLCWGSGDTDRPWTDLRAMEAKRRAWEAGECRKWLQGRLGLHIGLLRPCADALIKLLEKELRRRKPPEGVDHLMMYQDVVDLWIKTVRDLLGEVPEITS